MTTRNRNLYLLIAGVTVVISARLLHAAYTHDQWREFVVSEFVVIVSALSLSRLLRSRRESDV